MEVGASTCVYVCMSVHACVCVYGVCVWGVRGELIVYAHPRPCRGLVILARAHMCPCTGQGWVRNSGGLRIGPSP